MSKRRFKFSKLGMGKYISHLDLLRTFTRAIHRADLPVKYSQGFNPHQLITFSLPLPIGVTSETEFVDIDFEDTADNGEIIEKLNKNLPPDIKILSASVPSCKANDICAARYTVTIYNEGLSSEKIEEFFNQEEIAAVKKTKKGEKEINLRDFIKKWSLESAAEGTVTIEAVLSAGGSENIKPDIMVKKLEEFLNIGEFEGFDIHRLQIFYSDGKEIKNFC